MFKWDKWQKAVLEHEGNVALRSGRQVGKSTVIGKKSADFAKNHPGTITLVIAASQKQSGWLFDKIKSELELIFDKTFKYKEPPTKTKAILSNGSQIHSLPAGRTGFFIRGLALDLLIADEAAFIPEEVWRSVTPMIAVSRKERGLGWMILLSTPFGKGGFFYESCFDKDFKHFHVTSEQCPRIPAEFLRKERQRMSKMEYAQEYLAEFIDDYNQFFPTSLIKERMKFISWDRRTEYDKSKKYYLGVDIARYGGDENAFVIAEMDRKDNLKIVKALTTKRVSLSDTIGRIKDLNEKYNFRRIFIDDAGVGGGVYDVLEEKPQYKRKVVGLNNARRSVSADDRQKGIMKEDLYSNTLLLMEQERIDIISDLDLLRSMKSVLFEYTTERHLKIHGKYTHLTEALVRACWCVKEKGLNIYIA